MRRELDLTRAELSRALVKARAMLEVTKDGILVVDRSGQRSDFSERAISLWDLPRDLLELDHGAFTEFTSHRVARSDEYLARLDEIESSQPEETFDRIELHDGQVFERSSRLQRSDGQIEGRIWSFREVTERHRADEARAQLAAVIESSDDAIVSKTLDGTIRSWNEGARRIFGYQADEVIGKPITILLPKDRIHEEFDILRRLQRGERVKHFETVRVDKGGRLLDISVTISPIRDARGNVIGASKIARDISDRRRLDRATNFVANVNAALAEPTDYENALRAIATLAVPLFADWCFVDMQVSGSAARPFLVVHESTEKAQRARERLLQRPARATDRRGPGKVLRTGRPDLLDDIETVLSADPAPRQDEYLRTLRELGVTSYVSVLLRPSSEMASTLTFAMEASGHRMGAADLDAAEDLAQRAVIAIENAGLLTALREADRRKDDFLAILAHELRNPLAPIRNAVQLLRDDGSSQVDRRFAVSVMDRQIQQMSRLVEDLLDIARISRGKIELRKERIELAAVIQDAVETTRPLMEAQGHHLSLDVPKEPIFLDADPTRIAQVFSNLLSNAAKYTNPGGRIWVIAGSSSGEAVVRVLDNGIGIPEGMLTSIFDMFTQVQHSMEGARSGLGIGLTLVQRFVEMHGGTIRVTSPGLDQGSEFVVRLPLADRKAERPERSGGSETSTQARAGHRIMVVDDNFDGAESLALLLRRMGHEVRVEHDGLAAIEAVPEFDPRVVLLDIGLPKMNGYDVAARIREKHGNRMVLVAVTGWGQSEDRRRTHEAGFDYHMTKPVDFAVLKELLAGLSAHDEPVDSESRK